MEQQTGSKSGKEYVKAVYCHPAYLTYTQSASWETLGWMKHKLESYINNLRYADDTIPMAENEEKTKENLDESERGEWKCWLKAQQSENEDHGIWSHHFITNRWGNSERLYLGGGAPKSLQMVTAAMKLRHSLLGRKAMTNLDSVLKSREVKVKAFQ